MFFGKIRIVVNLLHIYVTRINEGGVIIMEYAKDEVFGIKYQGDITYQVKKKNKLLELIKRNYFVSGLAVIGSIFCLINVLLIYHFVNLLGEI